MIFEKNPRATDPKTLPAAVGGSLYHLDCFSLLATIPDGSIDCVWTDPPYLLSNGGTTCNSGKRVSVSKGLWDRSRGLRGDYAFHAKWIRECYRVLKPGGSIWVSGTIHAYLTIGMALQLSGFRLINDIVWEKLAPPPNLGRRCFTHATEILLWATKATPGARHTFNYDDMVGENGGRQMKNVWRIGRPTSRERQFGKHPTQKPVALIDRCLRATTKPGDIVLDPFTGSASTGVAAIGLGRGFIGCEREDSYYSLAVARLAAEQSRLF